MKIFISHSSADKRFVRTLKTDLVENGLSTWVDEDELQLGDSLVDKLEKAINDSSHFLIILSPNSVESEWVKLELNKAKLLKDQSILKKLIPIKYRECEIPEDLNGLLYADLSNEIVQADNEKIKFVSDGYSGFLNKVIRTIRASDKVLTELDKTKLLKEIRVIEKEDDKLLTEVKSSDLKKLTSITLLLKVIKFKDKNAVGTWAKFIKDNTTFEVTKNKNAQEIYPLILPTTIKLISGDFKVGEELTIRHNGSEARGQFGGYRRKLDTYTIGMPGAIRRLTSISENKIYIFEFDMESKTITLRDL